MPWSSFPCFWGKTARKTTKKARICMLGEPLKCLGREKRSKQQGIPCKWKNRRRIWPGEGSTVQWKWSPPAPGSLKTLLLPPLLNNVQTRERKGYRRGTARNFLHSFPFSNTPVVQSYWAWKKARKSQKKKGKARKRSGWFTNHPNHWGFFLKPQPPHTRQKYEQKYGPQTAEFTFFEAFGVIFCPGVCSYFALYVGAGVTSVFLRVPLMGWQCLT